MLFNSYIFVLLFLPLCLVGWFSLNRLPSRKPALLFLLGMSLWFYGYFTPSTFQSFCAASAGIIF